MWQSCHFHYISLHTQNVNFKCNNFSWYIKLVDVIIPMYDTLTELS